MDSRRGIGSGPGAEARELREVEIDVGLPARLLARAVELAAMCRPDISAQEFDGWLSGELWAVGQRLDGGWRRAQTLRAPEEQIEELDRAMAQWWRDLQNLRLPLGWAITEDIALTSRVQAPAVPDSLTMSQLALLLGPGVPDATRFKMATQLAPKVQGPARPGVCSELPELRRREKIALMPASLILAAARRAERQRVRIGRVWIKADDRRLSAAIPPAALPTGALWAWLQSRARRETADVLSPRPLDRRVNVDIDPDPSPLDALIVAENHAGRAGRLAAAEAAASPRQRDLLKLLGLGHSLSSAARRLGLKPETARVQFHRLRSKIRPPM